MSKKLHIAKKKIDSLFCSSGFHRCQGNHRDSRGIWQNHGSCFPGSVHQHMQYSHAGRYQQCQRTHTKRWLNDGVLNLLKWNTLAFAFKPAIEQAWGDHKGLFPPNVTLKHFNKEKILNLSFSNCQRGTTWKKAVALSAPVRIFFFRREHTPFPQTRQQCLN